MLNDVTIDHIGSPLRVLLVEDSNPDAQVLQALLREHGFEITRAISLSQALAALKTTTPDAILLDLSLPDSTGLDTVARVLDATQSIPVVVLTGTANEGMAIAAVAAGAQDYLQKGLTDGRTLVRAIRYARERHRMRQRLRSSQARFRALVENSADGIALLDRTGTIVYASPAVTRILGWRVDEFEGRSVFEFVHHDDRAEARQAFAEILTGTVQQLTERRYRCKDGSWRFLQVSRRNRLDDPAVEAIVVNYRDVTERRQLKEQVEQSRRIASLGRVVASVAHEFNNVLMATQPFAETILKRAGNDRQIAHAAEKIIEGSKRGARLTTQILRYSSPAAPRFETLDVGAWVRELGDETKHLARHRSVVIDAEESLMVRADPHQLQQIVANLVVNARDATSPGGEIRINVAPATASAFVADAVPEASRFVTLSVCDNGSGIAPNVLERIFEPLFTTKRHGGTGLGLPVAQQIVVDHGGRLLVQPEHAAGTCFYVVLPRVNGLLAA